jgi:hypothetical protein
VNKLRSLIESGLIDKEDGAILDTRTNLLWQQNPPKEGMTWQEANKYCKSLTLAGYKDWRLPTFDELKTLINKKYNPTIDSIFKCVLSYYWSSSSYVFFPSYAWFVSFYDGYVDGGRKGNSYFVRAVREVNHV